MGDVAPPLVLPSLDCHSPPPTQPFVALGLMGEPAPRPGPPPWREAGSGQGKKARSGPEPGFAGSAVCRPKSILDRGVALPSASPLSKLTRPDLVPRRGASSGELVLLDPPLRRGAPASTSFPKAGPMAGRQTRRTSF